MSKKKIVIIVSAVCIVFVLLISLALCFYFFKTHNSKKHYFEKAWGLEMPDKVKEDFYTDTGEWFGEINRYAVFIVNEQKNYFKNFKNDTELFAKDKFSTTINSYKEALVIPQEKLPDFSKKYSYYYKIAEDDERNWMLAIWCESENKLYIMTETR